MTFAGDNFWQKINLNSSSNFPQSGYSTTQLPMICLMLHQANITSLLSREFISNSKKIPAFLELCSCVLLDLLSFLLTLKFYRNITYHNIKDNGVNYTSCRTTFQSFPCFFHILPFLSRAGQRGDDPYLINKTGLRSIQIFTKIEWNTAPQIKKV